MTDEARAAVAAQLITTNPQSFKLCVAVGFGETLCEPHSKGPCYRLREGVVTICYACALKHGEPPHEAEALKIAAAKREG